MTIQPSLGTSSMRAMLEFKAGRICRSTSSRFDASVPAFQLMNEKHEMSSFGLRLSGLWTCVPRWKFTGG
eukprot:4641128-Lingulodinium_polyedra.AAC.1